MHAQNDVKSGEPAIDPRDAWLYNREAAFYLSDEWMVHYQKVLTCPQKNPHSWVDCPFAHKGERAKRRDLRIFSYSSDPCESARKNLPCSKGDACSKSHHVYESWLHPELYRTRMCAAGPHCLRRVCFFAHSTAQLRRPTKLLCGLADGQPVSEQQQQQQGIDSGLSGNAPAQQQAELTAVVEPWPESWGFGAASAAAAAAATATSAQDAHSEADRQHQRERQQQQRVDSCSADDAASSKAGQRSLTPAAVASSSGAATPTSGRPSTDMSRRQQQQQQHKTARAASPSLNASLLQLKQQQQQHAHVGSGVVRQGSGGEACMLPGCSSLASNVNTAVRQQQQQQQKQRQWQQCVATPSPDIAAAAAELLAGAGSPSSNNRQVVGYESQLLSPPTAVATHPCRGRSPSNLMQQAVDVAGTGGSGMAAAAGAAAGLPHSTGTARYQLTPGPQAQHAQQQHALPYQSQQQQQQQHLLSNAYMPSAVAAAAAEWALAASEVHAAGKASPSATAAAAAAAAATAATAAAAHDALVQSLAVANVAATANQLAQLQLLSSTAQTSGMQWSGDQLGPGWGLIRGASASLNRYGSGLQSSCSGSLSAVSGTARSSCDFTSSGPGLTASGLTTSGSGLTAPGWSPTVSGMATSGLGLTAPGWGSSVPGLRSAGAGMSTSDLASSGSGLAPGGTGLTAPGWDLPMSRPTSAQTGAAPFAYGHQQLQLNQRTRLGQDLGADGLQSLQDGLGLQAGADYNLPYKSTLLSLPEFLAYQHALNAPAASAAAAAAYRAYAAGANAAASAGQYQTREQVATGTAAGAVALHQQVLQAAMRAHATASAVAAGGMQALQSIEDSGGFNSSSTQAALQLLQGNWPHQ